MRTEVHGEHDKEHKANYPHSTADERGGFIDREPVPDTARDTSMPGTTASSEVPPPVDLISREPSSMLYEPPSEVENVDIHLHQNKSWTRHDLLPSPSWLKAFNISETEARPKLSDLRMLLENLDKESTKKTQNFDKESTKQPENLDKGGTKETANTENHHVNSLRFTIVKEEKVEYTGECLREGHTDVCEGKVVKPQDKECRVECVGERQASTQTHNESALFTQQESNPTTQRVANAVQTRRISKPQKLAAVSDTWHAETCLQQESNAEMLEPQKAVEVSHTPVAKTCYMSTKHSRQELNQESLEAQELPDFAHVKNDINLAIVDRRGMKQREGTTWKGSNKRERPSTEKISKHATASQRKWSRTEHTMDKANNMQTTLEAAERLDIARISAFKLTRRKDGGTNPMFSRLQKLKQEGSAASNVSHSNNYERRACNASQCWGEVSDSLTEPTIPQKHQSSDLPPGSWDSPDQIATQKSPELPPGFEEPSVLSPDSPTLPPGFWKPCGGPEWSDPVLDDAKYEDMGDVNSSDESPTLPPGFSEVYDPFSIQESPTLPPGFGDTDVPPGFWMSPDREASFSSPCHEAKESFGTPPKQVFIANIPNDHDGVVEQKLYCLVRELLEGFKSVPISATLPRKIHVTQDHGFVEFCCEAMAGVFMDAYHANASVMRIDGEQLLAARSLHLMRMDVQLRRAVADRIRGEVLDPHNAFYLGNVPPEWQNEKRLSSHIFNLMEGETTMNSKTVSVYTIPDFSDVYVHFSTSLLAETFFLRCLSDREHLEKISASLFVCRNSAFLPRAARVKLG